MKIFANKNIWKKLAIALLIITLASFVTPRPVGASDIGTFTGELLTPIAEFVTAIGDGAMHLIHSCILSQNISTIGIDFSGDNTIWGVVLLVLAVGCFIVAGIASRGVGWAYLVTKIVASCLAGALAIGRSFGNF